MIDITFFEHQQTQGRTIAVKPGTNLMRAALAHDVDAVAADCGGTLTCATCHVMVREPWLAKLPAMKADEDSMLDYAAFARQANSRLSCQIEVNELLQGMEIDLPPTQY